MAFFRGKRKRGLFLSRTKRNSYKFRMSLENNTSPLPSPAKSPQSKRLRISFTPLKSPHKFTITMKTSTPVKVKKRRKLFNDIDLHAENVANLSVESSGISFEDWEGESIHGENAKDTFEFSLQEEYLNENLSTSASYQHIANVASPNNYQELFSDALEILDDKGLKMDFINFLTLLTTDQFPLDNVSFCLFLDVVKWFAANDTRQMRYGDTTMKFFWLGKKLFGSRLLRFMSGPKNETDLLIGKTALSPANSKINFACPSENILRKYNPIGTENNTSNMPGLISNMMDLKARKDNGEVSYVLMFDGKKVKRGEDADLLGFEEGETFKERKRIFAEKMEVIEQASDTN